jgi:chemotaxis protein histidine kinase CheA
MNWADDPELLATFRTEVEDRLMSLGEGLRRLEDEGAGRALIATLFRDAHTVKGSARMLGIEDVVTIAHRAEDVLGGLRDGRLQVSRPLVDVLLVACTALNRGLPGSATPLAAGDAATVVAALDACLSGESFDVPLLASDADRADDVPRRRGEAVRVPPARLYDLLDVVGEAELEMRRVDRRSSVVLSTLDQHSERLAALRHAASRHPLPPDIADAVHGLVALEDQLVIASRELRSGVEDAQGRLATVRARSMSLAMVPLGRVAAGFPQLVREVAHSTGKDVRLVVAGDEVELDSRVLDGIAEALGHLLTNAVDHGCEAPATRRAAGKSPTATVRLAARAAGSTVVLEVSDDGAGIDLDAVKQLAVERGLLSAQSPATDAVVLPLLFAPGFTTLDDVTRTSGRGVGLHAVRTAVEELGGTLEVDTSATGTTFTITVPVTLGVMRCLMARIGDERYAIPLTGVVETVSIDRTMLSEVAGAPVLVRSDVALPVADLGSALDVTGDRDPRVGVVVRFGGAGESLVWAVDGLEGESEVVVKELGGFLGRPSGLAGATLDSDGSVVLLLDVRELAMTRLSATAPSHLPQQAPRRHVDPESLRRPRVLVVEDSIGVRELERVVLEGAGYEVVTAVDGLDGARRLAGSPVDAVVSDVEMPGMDGFTFTRTLRSTRGWEDVPVVIMTSRGDDADQRAGLDAGASAYLLKSEFDQHELVETVRRLVGR